MVLIIVLCKINLTTQGINEAFVELFDHKQVYHSIVRRLYLDRS